MQPTNPEWGGEPEMRNTSKRGPRTRALQKMHGIALPMKPFDGSTEVPVPLPDPGLADVSNEPDNFCRIETSIPSHSRVPKGEGDDTRSDMPLGRFETDPSGVTPYFQALLAKGEFDSVCPSTAASLLLLLSASHRLRLACSAELAESGRFAPILRQLLARSQDLACEALPQPQEGCGR